MFNSDKILQEIIYLLSLNGGRMNLLKLMKELYLIDRESIQERDTSISGDVFFSMPHGPVLSATCNLLRDLPLNSWGNYLEEVKTQYFPDINLKNSINLDRLSEKDKEYIKVISERFKDYSPKQIEAYTHDLPEWRDPKGSSLKIRYRDIMLALGKSEDEIKEAKAEYEQHNNFLSLVQ